MLERGRLGSNQENTSSPLAQKLKRTQWKADLLTNCIAIVQARMGSHRRSGKSLIELDGKPLIFHVLERALSIESCHSVVMATTSRAEDDELVRLVSDRYKSNVGIFRGDSADVQSRFLQVGALFEAEYIARITADDPFKDPVAYDKVLSVAIKEDLDYVALRHERLPIGLDAEAFALRALQASRSSFDSALNREHVTIELRSNSSFSKKFIKLEESVDLAHVRLTVDYDSDISLNQDLARTLRKSGGGFGLMETITCLRKVLENESRKLA